MIIIIVNNAILTVQAVLIICNVHSVPKISFFMMVNVNLHVELDIFR